MTPRLAASHLAGGPGYCLHSGQGGGPRGSGRSKTSRDPFIPTCARPGPQTPPRLTAPTKAHRPISPDSVWKGLGSSTSATAVQGLRPTITGDGGGGHQKACGLPGKENSSTVKQLTFPSQSKLRPLPLPRPLRVFSNPAPRGIVGICKAGKIAWEGSPSDYETGQELQFPAGCEAAEAAVESGQKSPARAAGMERC